jgi:hypothetical protein
MESSPEHEREVRAARNESLFRSVNKRLVELNEAFASVTGTFTIACECADASCVAMLEIEPAEYSAVRAEPHQFIVLAGHVVSGVEVVVRESEAYCVVEKIGLAAVVAEALVEDSPEQQTPSA